MSDDLMKRLRFEGLYGPDTGYDERQPMLDNMQEAADRIEELERHVELRDFFLLENDLWEKFAKNVENIS